MKDAFLYGEGPLWKLLLVLFGIYGLLYLITCTLFVLMYLIVGGGSHWIISGFLVFVLAFLVWLKIMDVATRFVQRF